MALKPDRVELLTNVSFFMTSVAERGGIACVTGTGAGASMDDGSAVVAYAAHPSGNKPIGLLLNDVVDIDLTRQHINWYRDEVQKGGKVTLLRQGEVVTDMIDGSPEAGDDAYVGDDGELSTTSTNSVKVGQFLSEKDAAGFARVSINIV